MEKKQNRTKSKKLFKAGKSASGGAQLGAHLARSVGGVGIAVGGTAFSVPIIVFVLAGAVLGLAAYGVCSIFEDDAIP